jgi:hypothetical protein
MANWKEPERSDRKHIFTIGLLSMNLHGETEIRVYKRNSCWLQEVNRCECNLCQFCLASRHKHMARVFP